ncbi:MAG: acyl-CoA dehydrogenase, partial [Mycobacterium sp.]|nr:acyl-CoA dehydrogenase [Mycobacterium sp.]
MLEDGLRKTMLSTSGAELDAALRELGWADMLSEMHEAAIPLVFRLLGETGSHASILNDVVLLTSGGEPGTTPALPYAGGGWVVWDYAAAAESSALGGLPLRRVEEGGHLRLPDARRAVGWWLVGSARAMLALA